MAGGNKTSILIGSLLLIVSFGCTVGVLYFMFSDQRAQAETIQTLEQKAEFLNTEKTIAEQRALEMENDLGRFLDVDKLVSTARSSYGPDEKMRKEGQLWVDRVSKKMVVTLGAVHGLAKDSSLNVYSGSEFFGSVKVDAALDVLSYVTPVNKRLDDFKEDYYRVERE